MPDPRTPEERLAALTTSDERDLPTDTVPDEDDDFEAESDDLNDLIDDEGNLR